MKGFGRNNGSARGWRQIADDVVVMSFPLRAFGIDFRRNVTLLRIADGRVVIHSTAPFTQKDVAAIRRFGEPAWLLDATLMHETFAKEGRATLPNLLIWHRMGSRRPAELRLSPLILHLRLGRAKLMRSKSKAQKRTSMPCFTVARARW